MLEYLKKASEAYYSGTPFLTDSEFDYLEEINNYSLVGAKEGDEKHYNQLYSLHKIFVGQDAPGFTKDWRGTTVGTPKLDGSAISILYLDGVIEKAITRGDGKVGKDITKLIKYSTLVPQEIDLKKPVFIVGELVAPKTIKNARNYAAGATGLKNSYDFNQRDLTFIAYSVSGLPFNDYIQQLDYIKKEWDFKVVIQSDWKEFPQDGTVIRLADSEEYDKMGFTSKHPKGAYAIKDQQDFEVGVTILRDVKWQVGHSGQVTPVGIFDPVEVDGAILSKASLANAGILEALDLSIGDKINVVRSGGIIPQIIGKVVD